MDQQRNPEDEDEVARQLFNYFTGTRQPAAKYEDQPQDVKDLWIGAARVAIRFIKNP
jgi:hypothetical protein